MRKKVLNYFKRYFILCLGLFLYSIAFNLFMLPNNFVVGGVSGLSIILNDFLNVDPSFTVSFLSILLLIIGFIFCNKDRMYSSVASSLILPLFIKLTSGITNLISINTSLLISSLYCSVLIGISCGFIYKVGFSTGGTDILYWILEKYIKKSTGSLMIIVEGTIVGIGAFVFGFERLLYSLIILFIMSKLSDKLIIGISEYKLLCIVPYKYKEIDEYLDCRMGIKKVRLKSENKKDVIYCVVSNKEYQLVYNDIKNIDSKAFLSVNNTYETGGYFYEEKEYI